MPVVGSNIPFIDWLVGVSQAHGLVQCPRIIIAGLPNSGKSRLLWTLCETKSLPGSLFTASRSGSEKVGGHYPNLKLRADLIRGASAVIFMVDDTDWMSMDEATAELHALAAAPELKGAPFLVLGNKCDSKQAGTDIWIVGIFGVEFSADHSQAMSTQMLRHTLRVQQIASTKCPIRAFTCSVKGGWGYQDGITRHAIWCLQANTMPIRPAVRKYGKPSLKKSRAEQLFAELPRTPQKKTQPEPVIIEAELEPEQEEKKPDDVSEIAEQLLAVTLSDETTPADDEPKTPPISPRRAHPAPHSVARTPIQAPSPAQVLDDTEYSELQEDLRTLTWDDVCPFGDRIEKIAEASYAEVYRITNDRGVSIIKVIRLQSPIKPQTKAQERSGLVDEEPHSEDDLLGELKISEWLADIPGFVIYKERYVVQGKAPKVLLETHQSFHRRMKRKDPDRLQFYPSPSRYLDSTKFLVIELGDAGTALEDFSLTSLPQLWDVFLHTAIALARAEDLIQFEHRDLHEGNLCIRQVRPPSTTASTVPFGASGLDITILDYGLSRASDPSSPSDPPIAYDLEKDLSLFTSTHAPQCKVYREMRSFLLSGDRAHLPPEAHDVPYAPSAVADGAPMSWAGHHPYTNVLWLAYIYQWLVTHFTGEKKALAAWKRETREMARHLDPAAPRAVLSFGNGTTEPLLMPGSPTRNWRGSPSVSEPAAPLYSHGTPICIDVESHHAGQAVGTMAGACDP
ncbi:hypothetical protein QBC39DRAFT_334466 [Podospora conica]|nr:hypothetical protein QBC39DRAFT_334466 [Schizothecium conicum]